MRLGFFNRQGCQCDSVYRNVFKQLAALVVHRAWEQVKDFIRAFDNNVLQFGFLVPKRFRNCIGWVEKDPAAKFWSAVSVSETLIEIGLLKSLFLVERCNGLVNRLLQLVCKVQKVLSGR